MFKRVLKIERCNDCPFYKSKSFHIDGDYREHKLINYCTRKDVRRLTIVQEMDLNPPHWCPLERIQD